MFYALLLSVQLLFVPKIVNKPFRHAEYRDTLDNYVIIHYDSGPDINTTLRYLRRKRNSYHYIISKVGVIYKLIDPKYKANHAGLSYFDDHYSMNQYSIGICLQGSGMVPYTDAQYTSLTWLLNKLKQRFPDLSDKKILGHDAIALPIGRKKDPGQFFDWSRLYKSLAWQTTF